MAKPTAVMLEAWFWECPECEAENFFKGILREFESEEEREAEFRDYHRLQPWEQLPSDWSEFSCYHIPTEIGCPKCGVLCETYVPNAVEDGDE